MVTLGEKPACVPLSVVRSSGEWYDTTSLGSVLSAPWGWSGAQAPASKPQPSLSWTGSGSDAVVARKSPCSARHCVLREALNVTLGICRVVSGLGPGICPLRLGRLPSSPSHVPGDVPSSGVPFAWCQYGHWCFLLVSVALVFFLIFCFYKFVFKVHLFAWCGGL